jgi:hypothetical protein
MRTEPAPATILTMATHVSGAHADRRLLGLDLDTVGPALLVLALAGVLSLLIPSIDAKTSYRHEVQRGEVVRLATGITLVPATGWDVASGAIVGQTRSAIGGTASTELVRDGLRFGVEAAPFAGTPSALLTRINKIDESLHHARARASQTTRHYAVTTGQGTVGVAEDFVGISRQGSVIAFVFQQTAKTAQGRQRTREGVEVVVSGPAESLSRNRKQIVAMIRSIAVAP